MTAESSGHSLKESYYNSTCPNVEAIIRTAVQVAFSKNPGVAAGLLRLHFHDCFVRGCDGSILLDGDSTEKLATPNLSLQEEAFLVIDEVKKKVEEKCIGVVSCADILAYAARDSVVLTKGRSWEVPAGRKDGTISLQSEPANILPPSFFNVPLLTQAFNNVGLTQKDMVILSGSHTIGVSTCQGFIARLYNFNATFDIDPTLNPKLANALRQACPKENPSSSIEVNMDTTVITFDSSYYTGLLANRGLFTSDQSLFLDPSTTSLVRSFASNQPLFLKSFADSMIKMSLINVLTETEGQIRKNCRVINPY